MEVNTPFGVLTNGIADSRQSVHVDIPSCTTIKYRPLVVCFVDYQVIC